ncbi:MAG: Gfo/Idh/MocA family oxidoreductase, partial [Bryobacteraceae bacterium]|nr:Gfo/Idh/MocA family oxidoreductase [Bryobacteraceae bacterium]
EMYARFPDVPKYRDFRKMLDKEKGIDAVVVATPDHMHAIASLAAIQLGKHVYCEKPLTHTVHEARVLAKAAREKGVATQMGNQGMAFEGNRLITEWLQAGAIGTVREVHAWSDRPTHYGKLMWAQGMERPTDTPPVPATLDWDLWLGPAPEQPYHGNLVHYNWHWFWDFGNGELGNNGIHLVDISRWGIGKELPVKVHCWGGRFGYKDQAETPNTQTVTWQYADGSAIVGEIRGLYTTEPMHWDFFGSKGHLHIAANGEFQILLGRNKQTEPPVEPLPEMNHYANFAGAVRTRNRDMLAAEIRETHLSTALCHLGNIAYRVGREVRFDPAAGRFIDAPDADKLLTRRYRPPYVVPDRI